MAEKAGGTCAVRARSPSIAARTTSGSGARHLSPLGLSTLGVQRVGRDSERDRGLVRLVERREPRHELRGLADRDDEDSGRHRIEGAGVPDFARAEGATHARDDVMARETAGFVEDDHAAGACDRSAGPP
jgi:hypothetical protein